MGIFWKPVRQYFHDHSWREWLPDMLILVYLLLGLVVFVALPFLADMWVVGINSESDQNLILGIAYIVGLINLLCGFWVFLIKRFQSTGQAFTVFAVSAAFVIGLLISPEIQRHLLILWFLGLSFSGFGLVLLGAVFPHQHPWIENGQSPRWIGITILVLICLLILIQVFPASRLSGYTASWRLETILAATVNLVGIIIIFIRWLTEKSPVGREQLRLILWGVVFSFGPMVAFIVFRGIFWPSLNFSTYLLIPTAIFPILVGYTIQRYRLAKTNYVVSRAVLYGSLTILITLGYALMVSGLGLIFSASLEKVYPFLTGMVIFLIALIVNPLKKFMENTIDRFFFRGEKAYQDTLLRFGNELTNSVGLLEIIKALRHEIEQTLLPNGLHIFILDSFSDQYRATTDRFGDLSSDLTFAETNILPQILKTTRSSIFIPDFDHVPPSLQSEKIRLQLLNCQVYIPLPGRDHLTGWLALGPRLSGETYSSRDINFLENICDQAALAIERAQVVSDLETRMRQLNVLTRVAQGINITISLDDMLELIYAQTTQVIPADDFRIVLVGNPHSGELEPIFNVVNNERLIETENIILYPETEIERDVVQLRRPIFTDDYLRECQRRGVAVNSQGVFAYMSVPLNSGAGTIGAISLGSRDSSVSYNQEQLNLFQSIADQAAGAIIKARLLQETERRARQLAILNEVTRQLTSTLDQEPLLFSILQSAVDILECEAGSLLMVDEQTDELVFRVTVGPVAYDLINKRLPRGTGMVGKAVTTRQYVLVNDVRQAPEWFSQTDQQTGFTTRAALAVPMQVKERVIGVIEVINKKSGQSFAMEDLDLLSAFAGQAAVAIENARLYTSTDEALTARVDELSVMQRIDRELNTSLDISRAMQITLEWAMRQSKADAGLVGIVEPDGLRIMASQGYTNELDDYQQAFLVYDGTPFEEAIQSGVPARNVPTGQKNGLFREAVSQTIIPIRREAATIGLLVLESKNATAISEDVLNFLIRLSDHASIAISNSQLYAAVQSANIAKSEFVSFVSHELKNPMTSIKGYTELLAAGAVGPINDMQSNFLSTIRSNVERMSTLVSDLADVSRIEAGRLRLNFKSVSLTEVVEEVTRSLKRQVEDKKQTITLQLAENLINVWADRDRLLQILTNLVSNANKYTPAEGQFSIHADVSDNIWDHSGAKQVVHIWVQDTGIGISPEDQKKIFQKFFRSEDPKTREAPGTGLGLNITKSLVEMMGGRIWFESEYRKGTTFHFTVPIAE